MLGQLLVGQKKDLAGAEAEFRQASDLDKKNVEALVKLGMVQSERGATDQALQTYLDGAKTNPKEIAFYLLAGSIYETNRIGTTPNSSTKKRWRFSLKIRWPLIIWPM